MSRYTWGAIDRNTSAEAAIHLSHQARGRFGLTNYPIDVMRDVAIAELLATTDDLINVKSHGAKADAAADDGIPFNLARGALPATGGTLLVPRGTYLLTTAFTFGGQDDVVLWLMPGVVLTGEALPTATGNNYILDWRSGSIGGFSTLGVTSTLTVGGVLSVDDTTDATSALVASLQTDGGMACVKDAWIGAQLNVAGTGPHVIGGTAVNYVALDITGAFTGLGGTTALRGVRVSHTLTGAVGDTAHLVGALFSSTIATQGTDTNIGVVAQAYFQEPGITNNLASAGKPDVAATVYIENAPTEGDVNAALYVAAGAAIFKSVVGLGTDSSASTFANTPASTTAVSSLRMAHGSAPSSPVNGDMWTTTAGLFVRINGSTVGALS